MKTGVLYFFCKVNLRRLLPQDDGKDVIPVFSQGLFPFLGQSCHRRDDTDISICRLWVFLFGDTSGCPLSFLP